MNDTGAGPVVIFGGRSEIGVEVAERLASGPAWCWPRGVPTSSTSRSVRCARRGRRRRIPSFDADDLASHGPLVQRLVAEHGPIGTAVLAFGILGDQARAEA